LGGLEDCYMYGKTMENPFGWDFGNSKNTLFRSLIRKEGFLKVG